MCIRDRSHTVHRQPAMLPEFFSSKTEKFFIRYTKAVNRVRKCIRWSRIRLRYLRQVVSSMHKGIFSRLAKQNIRNNKSTYIPYIITCIFCIAMIYMMEFLRDCPTLDLSLIHILLERFRAKRQIFFYCISCFMFFPT